MLLVMLYNDDRQQEYDKKAELYFTDIKEIIDLISA